MRKSIWGLALAAVAALVVAGSAAAQPPGKRGGPKGGPRGPGGPPGGLQRVLDDLKLAEGKKDTATAAVRAYQENVRKVTELARAGLLMELKDVLSKEELAKVREAPEGPRGGPGFGPGPGRGPGRGPGGPGRQLTADDIVARILSFDKNKDGKITKDELPERMQDLIAKGDTNKDGVLDNAEIKKLAADMARAGSFPGRGPGRGPGGPGRGPAFAGPPPNSVERAVIALKLSGTKKEKATTAVKAYQENVRKMTQLARADLLLKMSDVLGQEDLKTFKTALDRQPTFGDRPGPGGPPPGRGPGGRPRR